MSAQMTDLRILLVEDNLALCQGWAELLELLGYDIRWCLQAQDALRLQQAGERFDVVITDYYLPDMNGVELIRRMRKPNPTLPAAILTGSREPFIEDAVKALGEAVIQYKPLKIEELEAAILQLLDSSTPARRANGQ